MSPRYFESCFVIVDGNDVVAGSAVAVSPALLISVMHVIKDSTDLYACQDIKRDMKGNAVSYPSGKFKVNIVAKGDANVDGLYFVVLELTDSSKKEQLEYLPIATQVEKGEYVTLYFAFNATAFNEFAQDFCNIAIDTVQHIRTTFESHIYCSKGSDIDNSGGPYMNRRGEVVAIHTSVSNNGTLAVHEETTACKKTRLLEDTKRTDVTAKVVELCDDVSRISGTHNGHSIGLMIKNCPRLCEFLRSKGVKINCER
jgi:hypothetical protein